LDVYFNETSWNEFQKYEWNFGDSSYNVSSFVQSPEHTYERPGTFDVKLTITSKEGCKTLFTYLNLITVYPLPESEFSSDRGGTSIINGKIKFSNFTKINSKSYWNFGDGDSSDLKNPVHIYDSVGSFKVKLVSVTPYGCVDTAKGEIVVLEEYTFYAPTAFTPDNDLTNDYFYVTGNGIDPKSFKMMVFDRWGEKIFETNKYDNKNPELYGWDGQIKGKKMGENGSYTWVVIYKDKQQVEHQESGIVTLIK
jgi:gliding motility-associated-like protein